MKTYSKIWGIMALLPLAVALNCGATSLWWTGLTSTNWDLTTPNWETTSGTPFATFANGNSVIFDDVHSSASLVNVTTNVQPASVAFTNSVINYTLGGAGVIIATAFLAKAGTNAVTLNGTNSFGGGLNLSAGTLTLTASNTFGSASTMTGGTLNLNTANTFSGGLSIGNGTVTLGSANGAGTGTITLNNGAILSANGTSPGNAIAVAAGATNVTIQNNSASPGFGGVITSGDNTAVLTINDTSLSATTDQLDGFTGTVNIGASSVRFSSGGSNGGTNTTFNLIGTLYARNYYTTENIGALTGSGTLQGASGSEPGPATIYIGAKNINSTFNGTISEDSTGSSTAIVKVGTGTLTMAGTNTYTGATTVSAGTLTLTNSATLSNSPAITVNYGATLTLAGPSPFNQLTIFTNQTLSGGGVINASSLSLLAGATNWPGSGIGTLTVTGAVTSAGTIMMELNRTNSPATNSQLKAASVAITAGALIVTNLGPDLHTGDTFQLFSPAISGAGFATVSLPTSNLLNTVKYLWNNQLALNGSVQVLSGVSSGLATNPTNITSKVSGTNLILSWPSDHIGWTLQAQTNSRAAGLRNLATNWVDVANSTGVNSVTNAINPANGSVFYRLSSSP